MDLEPHLDLLESCLSRAGLRVTHREPGLALIPGDSRQMYELADGSVDLMVTDPPLLLLLQHSTSAGSTGASDPGP